MKYIFSPYSSIPVNFAELILVILNVFTQSGLFSLTVNYQPWQQTIGKLCQLCSEICKAHIVEKKNYCLSSKH